MSDDDRELMVRLAGYGAIAAVLASASWAGPVGSLVGWLFAAVALTIVGNDLLARVKDELEDYGDDVDEPVEQTGPRKSVEEVLEEQDPGYNPREVERVTSRAGANP